MGKRHNRTYDSERHHRRSLRLKGYDYAEVGAYFVTICTHHRACLFGDVAGDEMRLNEYGELIEACWNEIPNHFPHVQLDAFVVMPNHVHGIIVITGERPVIVGAGSPRPTGAETAPLPGVERPTLGRILAYFKYQPTKRINELRDTPGARVWQRNYYEHIVRDEASLDRVRRYILENPARWASDPENPQAVAPEPVEAWRA